MIGFQGLPIFFKVFEAFVATCWGLNVNMIFTGIDIENPVVNVNPVPVSGSKDALFCERVRVSGISRSKLASYANSFRIAVSPSAVIPEKLHSKIDVCFHRRVKCLNFTLTEHDVIYTFFL